MRSDRWLLALALIVPLLFAAVVNTHADEAGYGRLPLVFEANQGQVDSRVTFLARGSGIQLFLTPTDAVYRLSSDERVAVLRLRLLGGNPAAQAVGSRRLAGESHYLSNAEARRAVTHVPHYGGVEMRGVYPGIDLIYYGNGSSLEYDFVVAPRANPRAIDIAIDGATAVDVNARGELVVRTAAGDLVWRAPAMYQDIGSTRRTVRGGYVRRGPGRIGFRIDAYDRAYPLVIDPILAYWSTFGGSGIDHATAIAVDANGEAIITGDAASADFPTTPGAYKTSQTAPTEVFVSRLTADGTGLIYSTFLGPGRGTGVALRGGQAYVTGRGAGSFPTTPGAFTDGTAGSNVFVAKLTSDGSGLVYSSLFGGGSSEGAGIAVDAAGNAYVTGTTVTPNFPTTPTALQPTRPTLGQVYLGDIDGFLVKLNASGSSLLYSTYLGSTENDFGNGVTVDANGYVYVAGTTTGRATPWAGFPAAASPFPATASAYKTTFLGASNAFVAKFDLLAAGAASLVYSTLVGGDNPTDDFTPGELGAAIAVDAAGQAYVAGTAGIYYPATAGAYGASTAGGAFVTKLSADGSARVYSAVVGATQGRAIGLDSAGNAMIAGIITSQADFTPIDPLAGVGGGSVFLARINAAGSAADYAIYLDGHLDVSIGVAVDPSDAVYVAGTSFPAPLNTNAFVAKVVTNRAPIADAGPDQHIQLGFPFTLDAGGSTDPDGDALTYTWREGSTVVGTGQTLTLSRPQGVHTFTLTVGDGALTASDEVTVDVEAALIINMFGTATGRVTSDDGQIDCVVGGTPSCVARYATPVTVTLTAIPDAGAVFAGWMFACSGTSTCAVTVSGNQVAGARFDVQQLVLTASAGPHGRITAPGLDCPPNCQVTLPYGTPITLTAVPDGGYLFDAWSGDCAGTTTTTCVLTLPTTTMAASASFKAITLDSLVVTPATATIGIHDQQPFRAIATFSDGSTRPLSGEHSLEASDQATCAIGTNGAVTCWGQSPATRPAFQNAVMLSAGTVRFCALFADGTVNCEGTPLPGISNAVAIASESVYVCALLGDGTIRCGDANGMTPVSAITNAVAIGAEGGGQACAVLADGTVSCWLGTGNTGASTAPLISGIDNAVAVAVGAAHACALTADGTVKCWGENQNGQLGDGTNNNSGAAVTVLNLTGAIGIVAGDYHSCALLSSGGVKCWGLAYANGTTADSSTPVAIAGLGIPVAIGAGAWHNCASYTDGTVKCWGLNNVGQLPNTGQFALTPFTIPGMADVVTVAWTSDSAAATMMASGRAIASSVGTASITASTRLLAAGATLTIVNTSTGAGVAVRPVDATTGGSPVEVTFSGVSQAGATTLTTSTSGPPVLAGFELGTPPLYFDLSTTATYTPPIQICVSYAGTVFTGQPQLFHFEGGAWTDVTTNVNTASQTVCGEVSSLSPFGVFQRAAAPACGATVAATPDVLWPPNHKMRRVTLAVTPGASCAAPVACRIESVASSEPVNGTGDGDTAPDWTIAGERALDLRAERDGSGAGRLYTMTLRCSVGGPTGFTTTATVTVPRPR